MAKMPTEFKEKFDVFYDGCGKIYDEYWDRMGFTHTKDEFRYTVGRRYVKVFCGNSIHSFVDMVMGSVLKPAGCNKPAKHARGNVFDDCNGLAGMTHHGPYYLK